LARLVVNWVEKGEFLSYRTDYPGGGFYAETYTLDPEQAVHLTSLFGPVISRVWSRLQADEASEFYIHPMNAKKTDYVVEFTNGNRVSFADAILGTVEL
jgi:hypothetical protein